MQTNKDLKGIFFYFDSLLVERRSEVLVYDIPAFFSALGGTLGLYVGFSMLSVMTIVYNIAQNRKGSKEKKKKEKKKTMDMRRKKRTVWPVRGAKIYPRSKMVD